MNQHSQNQLLQTLRWHYARELSRKKRSALLDAFCRATGKERKYAIKLLRRNRGPESRQGPPKARRGRQAVYGPGEIAVLKALWFLTEQPCGKRLKAVLALWLPAWERHHGPLPAEVKTKLLALSASHMDRLLKPFKVGQKTRRHAPANDVRSQVPLRTGPWEVDEPGWLEADTVAHCGGDMRGPHVWSVVMTCIQSHWTDLRASWTRADHFVHQRVRQAEQELPFSIRGLDSDNGGEWLNHTLHRYFRQRANPVVLTRSRPYRKNDNAHVEQRNLTHVRQFIGYARLDHPELVEALNELYGLWSLWNNLYSPTLKLLRKERVGTRLKKVYEKEARTPCQRLLAYPGLSQENRQKLLALLEENDPIELRARIAAQEKAFWELHRQLQAKTLTADQENAPKGDPEE